MVFSSAIFLFLFLPVVLILYYLVPARLKNTLLLIASLFFYAWGETFYLGIMLVSIGGNYLAGILLEKYRGVHQARWILALGIALNLLLLGSYKYANFIVDNLNILLLSLQFPAIELAPVHLPIGISFFTFQAISYIFDIYRNEAQVQKNPLNVALYISMFPQLIAGPIVRYHDISRQIIERHVSLTDFSWGSQRFIVGLGKKMLIANPLGLVADQIFALPAGQMDTSLAWLGITCYALQIYFDFSAYSDMAIGLGRLFGFTFLENFNYPYISQSIQEFWRRWHISLSNWFRDYLYIPMGGNRLRPWRVYVNLITVFFLCGLWHGASWNFVIWGMIHGAFLVLEKLGLSTLLSRAWRPLRHVYVLLVVLISWVFFRAEDLPAALSYLSSMFALGKTEAVALHASVYLPPLTQISLAVGAVFSAPLIPLLARRISHKLVLEPESGIGPPSILRHAIAAGVILALTTIFTLSSMYVAAGTYNPFIYFRF